MTPLPPDKSFVNSESKDNGNNENKENQEYNEKSEKIQKDDSINLLPKEKTDLDTSKESFLCPYCHSKFQRAENPNFCTHCGYRFPRDHKGNLIIDENGYAAHPFLGDKSASGPVPSHRIPQPSSQTLPPPPGTPYPPYPPAPGPYGSAPPGYGHVTPVAHPQSPPPGYAQMGVPPGVPLQAPSVGPYTPAPMPYAPQHFIPRKERSYSIKGGIGVSLLTFATIGILSVIFYFIASLFSLSYSVFSTGSMFLSILFLIIPTLWVQRYHKRRLSFMEKLSELGLDFKKYTGKEFLRECFIGFFFGLVGILMVWGLQYISRLLTIYFFGIDIVPYLSESSQFSMSAPSDFLSLLLFLVTMIFFVGPPEEVMFRGFVQKSFESKFKRSTSAVLTAMYFSLFHIFLYILQPPVFFFLIIPYFGVSLLLSFVRNWRNDVIASSVLHITYNSIEMILLFFMFL